VKTSNSLPISASPVEVATSEPTVTVTRRPQIQVQPADGLRYLEQDEYPAWDSLVDASPQGNVFCRSWWLKALPGDVRVLGYFRGGYLLAGIPLYFEHRFGLTLCRVPKLVHTWGVVLQPTTGKTNTVVHRQMQILNIFAKHLAKQRFFVQYFHPSLLNWLPFYWNGFCQTTRFGYVLDDLGDMGRIWDEMNGHARSSIRKAQRMGITIVPCDSGTVAAAAEKTFRKQHVPRPYTHEYLRQLCDTANQRGSGACFAAVDSERRVHGAAFVAWDSKRAYYVAGGSDPELRASGAESLLVWHSINFISGRAAAFDFAGSMIQPIEHFFRQFGGKLVPYNRILKLPRLVRACLNLLERL
jgi:Acetyltransferase (GNAT) domain